MQHICDSWVLVLGKNPNPYPNQNPHYLGVWMCENIRASDLKLQILPKLELLTKMGFSNSSYIMWWPVVDITPLTVLFKADADEWLLAPFMLFRPFVDSPPTRLIDDEDVDES